jgi:hypothetical protein
MAKKEKATCISCHRTAKGGRPGNSMLSPRGFNYLRGLIQSEAYVPLYTYQELQLLNAKIAENKRVQDGGAPLVQPAPESSPAPADTPAVEEPKPEPNSTPEPMESEAEKPVESRPPEPEPTRVSPAKVVDPKPVPELKPSQMAVTPPKPQTTPTKTTPPVNVIHAPVTDQPVPVVQPLTESKALPVEADGTVILPRPKPLPYYSWREDWEYDDYF